MLDTETIKYEFCYVMKSKHVTIGVCNFDQIGGSGKTLLCRHLLKETYYAFLFFPLPSVF